MEERRSHWYNCGSAKKIRSGLYWVISFFREKRFLVNDSMFQVRHIIVIFASVIAELSELKSLNPDSHLLTHLLSFQTSRH